MHLVVFSLCLTLLFNAVHSGEVSFQCKANEGCHLPKCDPVPFSWSNPVSWGNTEYPLTCKVGKEELFDEAYTEMQDQVKETQDNMQRIADLHEQRLLEAEERMNNKVNKEIGKVLGAMEQRMKGMEETLADMANQLAMVKASTMQTSTVWGPAQTTSTEGWGHPPSTTRGWVTHPTTISKRWGPPPSRTTTRRWGHPPSTTRGWAHSPTPTTTTVPPGACEMRYRGNCFWFEIHSSQDITYSDATAICHRKSSMMANVYSKQHYKLAAVFIRSKMPASMSMAWVWTGLRLNMKTLKLTYTTGHSAHYMKWYPGFPNTGDSGSNLIALEVRSDPNSAKQGMGNISPTHIQHGVMCELAETR